MSKKPTLSTVVDANKMASRINANDEALRDAFDNTISRDGSSPNQMEADFDLNSNDLLNVKDVNATNIIVSGVNLNDKVAEAATSADNAATSETNAAASAALIDTGNLPSLTVDIDTLHVDEINHRVGINTTSPSSLLDVAGEIQLGSIASATSDIRFRNVDAQDGSTRIRSVAHNLAFYISNLERTRLDANGALLHGTITEGSAGAGDIVVNGGIFLGGSAAANKLDDYEKGAWTPTWLSSGTLSLSAVDGITINNCFYTKINDLVRVDGEILMTNGPALVTSGGWIVCGGLPFPMNATTDGFATLGRGIGRKSLNSNDIVDYLMARNNSPTDFRFSYFSHAGTGAGDGHYISFSMEYRTSV